MKKNIAIVYGGFSGEAEVSANSVKLAYSHINKDKYYPVCIRIVDNDWIAELEGEEVAVNKDDFSLLHKGKRLTFDGVFNVIHGTPGEDGKLQGYFDMLGIPYNNSGVLASALTFNKYSCNNLLRCFGVKCADAFLVKKGDEVVEDEVLDKVGLPCFVKPNKGGSSLGVTRVDKAEDLRKALSSALKEDDEVLVESFIGGRELTSGVFRYKDELMAFPVTEIISKNKFFDYEAKYTVGGAEEVTPANVPEEISRQCQEISKKVYDIIECKGFVRCDYIWTGKEMYFLEVNTVPGMSGTSIVPQQYRAMGYTDDQMMEMSVEQLLMC